MKRSFGLVVGVMTSRGTALCTLAISLYLPLFFSGCINAYSLRSEEQNLTPPDLTTACGYPWSADDAYIRSVSMVSTSWMPANAFHDVIGPVLGEIQQECLGSIPAGEAEGKIAGHYLVYANKFTRAVGGLLYAPLGGFTLGVMPVLLTDHYVACLDITASDGLRRVGLAKGQVDVVMNAWGQRKRSDEARQQEERIWRDLTLQAWHKAWLPSQGGAEATHSCREELDAIVK